MVVKLATGKVMPAHGAVVGIDAALDIYGGWDDGLTWFAEEHMSKEDRAALADRMIDLWTKFKDRG